MYSVSRAERHAIMPTLDAHCTHAIRVVKCVAVAAAVGNTEYAVFAARLRVSHGWKPSRFRLEPADTAAKYGHLHTFIALVHIDEIPDQYVALCVLRACRRGNYNILHWALLYGARFIGEEITSCLAAGGKLELLRTVHRVTGRVPHDRLQMSAASGSIPVIEYALECGAALNTMYANAAAKYRRIETLKWLVNRGVTLSADTMGFAIDSGDLNTVRCLRQELHCPCPSAMCCAAASVGSLPILRYLHETPIHGNHVPLHDSTLTGALRGKRNAMLGVSRRRLASPQQYDAVIDYCVAHDCHIPPDATLNCIRADRQDLAQRFYDIRGGPRSHIYHSAVRRGHLQFIEWLHDVRHVEFPEHILCAAVRHMKTMMWLVDKGASVTYRLPEYAATFGSISAAKFAVGSGAAITEYAMATAVKRNREEILRYFIEHGGCITRTVRAAVSHRTGPQIIAILKSI